MKAISSFRPLGQDAEYDVNQIAAKATWDTVFDEVIFFNKPEPRMAGGNTKFLGNDEHPTITAMCKVASEQPGWSCLINADIMVNPLLNAALHIAHSRKAWALMSFRWQKAPTGGYQVTDNGLDFFAALPWVWLRASQVVPAKLRLGHQMWDTWMIGFLNGIAKGHFFNISRFRCIFHPIHGNRRYAFNVDGALDGYQGYCGPPPHLSLTIPIYEPKHA